MKTAFVIPWFHEAVSGGAESQCRDAARLLAGRGHSVTILTTCIRDHGSDWNNNHFPPGPAREGGLSVLRFAAASADRRRFDAINGKYLAMNEGLRVQLPPEEEDYFFGAMAPSPDLLSHIRERGREYDFIIFMPYLFATSVYGPALCPENAVLLPCLHDEGYAYSRPVTSAFRAAGAVIFNTRAERDLARNLYGTLPGRQAVIGDSISPSGCVGDAERFRRRHGIEGDFILCLGRRDRTKRTDQLVSYFLEYRKRSSRRVSLVLAGPGAIRLPRGPDLHDLGFLTEEEKYDALAACTLLCNPSLNESFSIVLLETWANGRPAAVAAACRPTADLCRDSGGGLAYKDFGGFCHIIDHFLEKPEEASLLGERGRAFTARRYSHDIIGRRYHDTLTAWKAGGETPPDLTGGKDGAWTRNAFGEEGPRLPEPPPVSLAPGRGLFTRLRDRLRRLSNKS